MTSRPPLSVVIASVNGRPYLDRCLEALARNAPEAEIVLADATDPPTRAHVRARWPAVRLVHDEETVTVPALRAAGIEAATGACVAVIEDHCLVHPGWSERLVRWHRQGKPAVGGPVRNVVTGRIRDWAAFLCEYSAFLEPVQLGPTQALTGMNVSYDERAIELVRDLLDEGRWEGWLHDRLLQRGVELWLDPELVIDHDKDFGFLEFTGQRFHYSRAYAGMRRAELGRRAWLYALGSPLLVPVLYARLRRNVSRTPHRGVLARATPLILFYLAVWAAGEAIGYASGGGRSLTRVR